jgi:hypothetical protein
MECSEYEGFMVGCNRINPADAPLHFPTQEVACAHCVDLLPHIGDFAQFSWGSPAKYGLAACGIARALMRGAVLQDEAAHNTIRAHIDAMYIPTATSLAILREVQALLLE